MEVGIVFPYTIQHEGVANSRGGGSIFNRWLEDN